MDLNFKNNVDFKNLLKNKQFLIIKQTTNDVLESENYKLLFANVKSLIKTNAFRGSKVILIKEELLDSTSALDSETINKLFSNSSFTTSDVVEINEKFEILDNVREPLPQKSHEARLLLRTLSQGGYLVFHIIETYVNAFINGHEFPESPFLSLADKKRHVEKKDVSELQTVFENYRQRLADQPVYCKFFISKSHLTSLHIDSSSPDDIKKYIPANSHILNNKCEDKFREDLRLFLKENLFINVIVKEYILESKKRLDIFLVDDYGENFYLIEVKWVGDSINPAGKKVSTKYNQNDINPDAIFQTLNYLEELDTKGENIVRAYLTVFDARKDNVGDTVENFDKSLLSHSQLKHYPKFEKIRDFRVINKHPS